jgi:hypothetical protein
MVRRRVELKIPVCSCFVRDGPWCRLGHSEVDEWTVESVGQSLTELQADWATDLFLVKQRIVAELRGVVSAPWENSELLECGQTLRRTCASRHRWLSCSSQPSQLLTQGKEVKANTLMSSSLVMTDSFRIHRASFRAFQFTVKGET